jgi:LL-H family phage holin
MEQFFKDFLTEISPILQNLLVVLVSALVAQVIAYVNKQYGIAKTKLSEGQRALLDFIAYRAVQAVEQLYKSEDSQAKRFEAIAIVEASLKQYGLKVDFDVIVNAIEAQVFERKTSLPYAANVLVEGPQG